MNSEVRRVQLKQVNLFYEWLNETKNKVNKEPRIVLYEVQKYSVVHVNVILHCVNDAALRVKHLV